MSENRPRIEQLAKVIIVLMMVSQRPAERIRLLQSLYFRAFFPGAAFSGVRISLLTEIKGFYCLLRP